MHSENKFIIISVFLWLIFILSIFIIGDNIKAFNLTNGYKLGNDSYFFLSQAKEVLTNLFPSHPNATSYIGFIYFLSLFEYFSIPLKYFVFFQIFENQ